VVGIVRLQARGRNRTHPPTRRRLLVVLLPSTAVALFLGRSVPSVLLTLALRPSRPPVFCVSIDVLVSRGRCPAFGRGPKQNTGLSCCLGVYRRAMTNKKEKGGVRLPRLTLFWTSGCGGSEIGLLESHSHSKKGQLKFIIKAAE